MKMKEAAKQLNTTPRTIRFYEEKGLLKLEKGANDYRYFKEKDLWRLQTILSLRELGMGTDRIKEALTEASPIHTYLNMQRSALYGEWLQLKDTIHTIETMLQKEEAQLSEEDLFYLANRLKGRKELRDKWEDEWNFNEQAKKYDLMIKTTGYRFNVHEGYDEALERVKVLADVSETCVGLDIGIGTGNLAEKFIHQGNKMIGVDQSEEMLKVCKEKHSEIDLRHGHFLALPVMDQGVDFIVSSYALHHLPDEKKITAFQEMERVLKPGGIIVIADLMFTDQKEREKTLADFAKEGNQEAIAAIEDEYYGNRRVLVEWLEVNGFSVRTEKINRILHVLKIQKSI